MRQEKRLFPRPSTKFLKVKCQCGNEQIVFNAATTRVVCLACSAPLLESGPSRATVKAKILAEMG